jgi:hypothetical protein
MLTYCRPLATNPGPARALVVESVACPAIRKVRAEYLTAWAPPRPSGTAAIGAVVHLLATAIEEGRDLDERHPGRHRLPSAAGLTARPHFRCRAKNRAASSTSNHGVPACPP